MKTIDEISRELNLEGWVAPPQPKNKTTRMKEERAARKIEKERLRIEALIRKEREREEKVELKRLEKEETEAKEMEQVSDKLLDLPAELARLKRYQVMCRHIRYGRSWISAEEAIVMLLEKYPHLS